MEDEADGKMEVSDPMGKVCFRLVLVRPTGRHWTKGGARMVRIMA